MKKVILVFIILFTGIVSLNAQKIEIKRTLGSNLLYQNNKRISMTKVLELMKNNNEAYKLMKSAKTNNIWGSVLGGVGGALIGFPIGIAIGGGKANWTLAGIGAGILVAAIPLNSAYNKKTKQAINLYNEGITATSYQFKPLFYLKTNRNGIAFTMSF